MDWIDPRYAAVSDRGSGSSGRRAKGKKRRSKKRARKTAAKPLSAQLSAAMAQPVEVWSSAFGHALASLKWPSGCNPETTLLWSVVMHEQAEVLVRAGLSANKLSSILAEGPDTSAESKAARLSSVVALMDYSLESMAFQWLDSVTEHARSALGIVGLTWHLPEHASRPGNSWLTQWLQTVSERIGKYEPEPDSSIVCHLVMQCELPLLIGLATSASKRTVLVEASHAMDNLAEHLEQSDDDPAPWLTHGATYLRAALASVLRCRVLANSLGLLNWYPPQQKALAGLLKHASRWSRPDGTQLLGAGNKSPRSKSIWSALAAHTKQPTSLTAAMTLSGIGEGKRGDVRRKVNPAKLPPLTHYSKGASNVCMQADWREKGCRIAVDFSDIEICIEALGPKGHPLLAGDWIARVERDGQAELQLDEWSEVCWFSDRDVDYLELEAQFGQHARVQRQIALFREEHKLFVADALLADGDGTWAIQSDLPLAPDCVFEPAKKTWEGAIKTPAGARCLALPLFLPEWRRQSSLSDTADRFTAHGDSLTGRSESSSNRQYVATCIQLENANSKEQLTWRQLTVGEDLRIVGADEAVAYRVQIGQEQLLIYRSLASATRRTTLGMHTMADFYAGRFDADEGEVDTIVEVEAS